MTNLDTIKAEATKRFEEAMRVRLVSVLALIPLSLVLSPKVMEKQIKEVVERYLNGNSILFAEEIDRVVGAVSEVDHSINIRYETDILEALNKFIKKWCGIHYTHLIDDDENDGQFVREKIDDLLQKLKDMKGGK